MIREIKFRAWNSKSKRWVCLEGLSNNISLEENRENEIWILDCGKTLDKYGIVLMQYTGLKDITGKEIYEGDVIDTKQCGIELVEMFQEYDLIGYRACWEKGKIIGNICENPELLDQNLNNK